jgi:phospholipase/lecithinase/hemolysin
MSFNLFPVLSNKISALNESFRTTDKSFKRSFKRLGYSDSQETRTNPVLDLAPTTNSVLDQPKDKANNQLVPNPFNSNTTDLVPSRQTIATPTPSSRPLVNTSVFPAQTQSSLDTSTISSISQASTPFSKLYIFGDSLSDQGNIFNITKFANSLEPQLPIVPNSPYFEGRFSNGPVWTDYLAAGLGLPIQISTKLSVLSPSIPISSPFALVNGELRVSPFFNGATTTQSVNFAFGGAQTGVTSGLAGTFSSLIPGVLQQVAWFINDHLSVGKTADSKALYVVFAGGNDYLDPSNALQPIQSVSNIALSIAALYSQGARNFLIPNLPDLGITPRALKGGTEAETRLSNLTIAHNTLLNQAIADLTTLLPQSNFIPLDFYGLLNNVAANPSQLGITNITEPSYDTTTGTIVGDPNTHLFWDEIHPTAIGHLSLGINALVSILNSTPQVNNLSAADPVLASLGNQSNFAQNTLLPDIFTPTFNKPATLIEVSQQT